MLSSTVLAPSRLGVRAADRGLSFPLGWLMCRSLDVPGDRAGKGLDALPMFLCRLLGRREPAAMDWKHYACALLAFNARPVRHHVRPALRPAQDPAAEPRRQGPARRPRLQDSAGDDHPGADTAVIFNTVCSFVTNTNLQHYSGEQHLSYFSQLACIVWLMFVTPASGLCVMLATLRGLRGTRTWATSTST